MGAILRDRSRTSIQGQTNEKESCSKKRTIDKERTTKGPKKLSRKNIIRKNIFYNALLLRKGWPTGIISICLSISLPTYLSVYLCIYIRIYILSQHIKQQQLQKENRKTFYTKTFQSCSLECNFFNNKLQSDFCS